MKIESGHVELPSFEQEHHNTDDDFVQADDERSEIKFIDIGAEETGQRYFSQKRCSRGILLLSIGCLVWAITSTALLVKSRSDKDDNDDHSIGWLPLPRGRLSNIAFGSCAEQAVPQPYWDTVVSLNVDLLILGGDNVYGDCHSEGCPELPNAYNELAAKPSFIGARSTIPMIMIWDDHDYGKNDGYGSNNEMKSFAKEKFLDFFDIYDERRDYISRGLQKSYQFEDLQIILLDTRWYRSAFDPTDENYAVYKERYLPSYEIDRTMLGEDQWQWLEAQLKEPAALRLIVSTIQIIADGHGWECWRMLPRERDRLYRLLKKYSQANGKDIILLTGDRHVGGLYKYQDVDDFVLYEATGSSWTHTGAHPQSPCDPYNASTTYNCDEPGPLRLGPLIRADNFVTADIDWDSSMLTLSIRRAHRTDGIGHLNNAGEILQSIQLPFSS